MDGGQEAARKGFPWTGCWVTLGIALRLFHYLRDPAMWHDEAALVLNVLGKDFAGMLGPLTFSEAAPPLFLWLEKAVVLALGEGTYALRLLPLVASCAALLGIVAVARRVLNAAAVPWAALLMACSDRLLWHSCEAKPYATDVLVAVGLLLLLVPDRAAFGGIVLPSPLVLGGGGELEGRPLWRPMVLAALATPLLVFVSYPACFLLGGLVLAWLPAVWRGRRWWEGGLYLAWIALLLGSFALLLLGPIHAQRDARLGACWQDMFPPWDRPWTVPAWVVLRLAEMARYAEEPVGNVLAGVAVLGGVVLWRAGRRRLVGFLLAPIGLATVAALLGKYPIGASRVVVFAAPAVLLLTAAGLPPALAWLRQWGRVGPALLAAVVLFPLGQAFFRVVVPWERADSDRAAVYVEAHRRPGECVFGTNWEHDYYFRNLAADYRPLDQSALPDASGRLWLVAAGKTEARRSAWWQDRLASGRVLDRRDFAQVTVLYLELRSPGPGRGRPGGR